MNNVFLLIFMYSVFGGVISIFLLFIGLLNSKFPIRPKISGIILVMMLILFTVSIINVVSKSQIYTNEKITLDEQPSTNTSFKEEITTNEIITENEISSSENEVIDSSNLTESQKFFEEAYVPFATHAEPYNFDGVRTFTEVNNYKSEIIEPINNKTLGQIFIYGKNGDYVYFNFFLIDNIETTDLINFHQDSNHLEVSVENHSGFGEIKFDKFTTRVLGEEEQKVNNVDEQREFLFGQ